MKIVNITLNKAAIKYILKSINNDLNNRDHLIPTKEWDLAYSLITELEEDLKKL